MLSNILSIAGKPGLYKLISTNKNLNIIESLSDGKRVPLHAREKVITLSDVSVYTNEGDTPLREVFKAIKEKQGGETVSYTHLDVYKRQSVPSSGSMAKIAMPSA